MSRCIVCMVLIALLATIAGCINSEQAPGVPNALRADEYLSCGIRLSWGGSFLSADTCVIERSISAPTDFHVLQEVVADSHMWIDAGLLDGTNYFYRLKAINAFGESGYSNVVAVTACKLPVVGILSSGDSFFLGDDSQGPDPNVQLSFTYSYERSKFKVTNAQFIEFISNGGYSTQSYWTANGWSQKITHSWTQPDYFDEKYNKDKNLAVVGLTWYTAVAFCNWYSDQAGLMRGYDSDGRIVPGSTGYRLPTESEWEYAAAKGSIGIAERIYAFGDSWDPSS